MKKKLRLKYKFKVQLVFFIFALSILILLISLTAFVNAKTYTKEIEKSFLYNENANLNYSVCLKENDYINDECITEKRSFVTSLIDHINLNLQYQLDSSDLVDYTYGYVIKAQVTANEKGEDNKILYTNEEVLKESAKYIGDVNFILLDENIDLDYQKYNEIITSFKKNYVLAVDSKINITATINVIGQQEGTAQTINNTYTLSISMPLAEQTVNITEETTSLKNSNIVATYKDKVEGYEGYKIASNILYKVDILYLFSVLIIIIILIPRKKKYDREISKILKNYDDVIVSVKKAPDLSDLNLIEVNNFGELLDAREALNKPIIYFESIHKDCSTFIISSDSDAYIYTITAYEKDKNE